MIYTYNRRTRTYRARMKNDKGKMAHIGTFKSLQTAAMTYWTMSRKMRGFD